MCVYLWLSLSLRFWGVTNRVLFYSSRWYKTCGRTWRMWGSTWSDSFSCLLFIWCMARQIWKNHCIKIQVTIIIRLRCRYLCIWWWMGVRVELLRWGGGGVLSAGWRWWNFWALESLVSYGSLTWLCVPAILFSWCRKECCLWLASERGCR